MPNSRKDSVRKAVVYLLSFFLSLFLFLTSIIMIIQLTFLNSGYMRSKLSESNYYDNVMTEAESEFISYGSASGFNEQFFQGVLDINDVQLSVNHSLSTLYGEDSGIDNSFKFQEDLKSRLSQNLKERKIAVTPEISKGVQLLANTCSSAYSQYISIPYANELKPYLLGLKKPLILLECMLCFLAVISVLLIMRLSRWPHRAFRAYIYAVSGAILMLFLFPVVFLISGKAENIAMISKSLYALSVSYLNGIAILALQLSAIFVCVLVVLVLIYIHLYKRICRDSEDSKGFGGRLYH